ncbi:MAG TPA: glycoside hydrolase family 31 protein [Puia sp.]|jgi:alpha-D-xyloside xylohydrolase|nr:glycoside hydrolase family 31 protein [Puia sp.]
MKHLFAALSLWLLVSSACAQVRSYGPAPGGVRFRFDKGLMEIDLLTADVARVRYTGLEAFAPKQSLVVTGAPGAAPAFTVREQGDEILILTDRLMVSVDRSTGGIAFSDPRGNVILAEDGRYGKTMTPATVVGEPTYTCTTRFLSPADEGLFGLGCHPLDSGSIDYKGRKQDLAIRYMTGAIPVLMSSRGYGLLWDNYSASEFDGTLPGKYSYSSESGTMVDYYFFYGPAFDHIIDSYRRLTGKAPMFPKWAFGLFQSQDRYRAQAEVLAAGAGYRNAHIPVDVVVQDWYYWEPLPIGSHVMNPQRYPDPKGMLDTLHRENLHGMISIWPVFGKGTADYDALAAMGGLTTITWDNVVTHTFDTYYDAHNPAARRLYWEQARDSLVKRYGWDAWWIDQCEPDNGSLLDERRKATFYTGRGFDYFNTYSLSHTDGVYQGWRRDIPGKRAFFLARQAFAGEQRNSVTLWSSDIQCTWHDFADQVPQGINACASGIPYWTSDIGGYHLAWKAPDWTDPDKREMFVRWFQFGAFCPVFRIHGKGERALFSRNWDEGTRGVLLAFDRLRYRLLPYIYSLAGRVTQENYTPMRALAFDFRTDAQVYPIRDQYMFGPAFLVNPVTVAGVRTRKVYLPAGAWYDFWTGKRLDGGQTVDAAAPVERMPLFVRAGSIVPMGPVMEYATERPADTIELRIYAGADGQFMLYEDGNDGYQYERGAFAEIPMEWVDARRQLVIGGRKGSFPGMLKHRVFRVVVVKEGHGTGAEAEIGADKVVEYSGKEMSVGM